MRDTEEFRLRPRRPRAPRENNPGAVWASAYLLLKRTARLMKTARRRRAANRRRAPRPWNQRCAVRITYSKNRSRGQWKAHGRYIARESATRVHAWQTGFDAGADGINIAARLDRWQRADDERLWKLIISPEFGERIDLRQLTRDLMKQMARDLETQLEWVAVSHFNTDNPHVHVALRGIRDDGQSLTLGRDYVKHGIRDIAERVCTRQIGYRTHLDVAAAQEREVSQQRFTALDRAIRKYGRTNDNSPEFVVTVNPAEPRNHYILARLKVLEGMRLAEAAGRDQWRVRLDFETALRGMQRVADRQRILAAHGVPISDPKLPFAVLDLSRMSSVVEGRVLGHGEDEASGSTFMMLESTEGMVYCVFHTPQMLEARAHRTLRANAFVRLQKRFVNRRPSLEAQDLGSAESVLDNRDLLEQSARRMMDRNETVQAQTHWSGWLGRYQNAVCDLVVELQHRPGVERPQGHSHER